MATEVQCLGPVGLDDDTFDIHFQNHKQPNQLDLILQIISRRFLDLLGRTEKTTGIRSFGFVRLESILSLHCGL
ncbi:hypothetical protein Pla110_21730 [Polystyrenella longa]|uniref:Uncharacterized protein n=1 Tax=Polystyrenella longa TaxID=2528007 RepID=A0A518CML0_9PLAN|nr:hypothetical protein Pla110_21730 [Polystyrenella longa]